MERICKVCNQSKNTPYKDMCRKCYQNHWITSIPIKICISCEKEFKNYGKICSTCRSNKNNEQSRTIPCSVCKRVGLIIANKTENLCIKCDRIIKEKEDPTRAKRRKDYNMIYSRKKKGTDLNRPRRKSSGLWKTCYGYVMVFKPEHPNANASGSISQHVFVMNEYLKRPLKKGESVHHINGQRDDNRIENLELWHRSHPP